MTSNSYNSPGITGGIREDLRKALTILYPEQTPYISTIAAKTGEARSVYSEQGLDTMPDITIDGTPEGGAANQGGNRFPKRQRFGVYQQRITESFGVSDVEQKVSEKGGNAFTSDEYADSQAKAFEVLKLRIESACLSTLAGQQGTNTTPMRTNGVFNWLSGSAATVGTDYQTPSTLRFTSVATLVEVGGSSVQDMLVNLASISGKTMEYKALVGNTYAKHVDAFSSGVTADVAFRTMNFGTPHTMDRRVTAVKFTHGTVHFIPSFHLNKGLSTITPNPKACLILTPEHWQVDYLEEPTIAEEKSDASGKSGAWRAMFANRCYHPQTSGYIVDTLHS
jgi:hypothetical protein